MGAVSRCWAISSLLGVAYAGVGSKGAAPDGIVTERRTRLVNGFQQLYNGDAHRCRLTQPFVADRTLNTNHTTFIISPHPGCGTAMLLTDIGFWLRRLTLLVVND